MSKRDEETLNADRPVYAIDNQILHGFFERCQHRSIPKNGIIIRSGDAADRMYYIVSGSAAVTSTEDDGTTVLLAYLREGDFVGEIGLFFRGQSRRVTVRARTACELAEIGYDQLDALMNGEQLRERAELLYAVGLQLSRRLLQSSRRVVRMASMDVPERVAQTLLDLCEEPNATPHQEGAQLHISRVELANIVGCTREMVARALKKLENEGKISVSGKDIVVRRNKI